MKLLCIIRTSELFGSAVSTSPPFLVSLNDSVSTNASLGLLGRLCHKINYRTAPQSIQHLDNALVTRVSSNCHLSAGRMSA